MKTEDIHKKYPWVKVGIDCGPGWLPLVAALCDRLQWYCDHHRIKYPEVRQIKDKFGSLCFYIDSENYHGNMGKGVYSIIGDYEAMSRYVCEECGTTVDVGWCTGWIKSVCQPCFDSKIKARWPDRVWKFDMNPIVEGARILHNITRL